MVPQLLGSNSARVFSKSGVLGTLGWVTFGLLAVLVALAAFNAATWLLVVVTVLAGICLLTFVGLYVYLAMKDRPALRSEHYALRHEAIEFLAGDSAQGLKRDLIMDADFSVVVQKSTQDPEELAAKEADKDVPLLTAAEARDVDEDQ